MNEMELFKFMIYRITQLSDKAAGLKAQNSILQKRISALEFENQKLDVENETLSQKLTELNHENISLKKQHETPSGFHGQVNIKEVKR